MKSARLLLVAITGIIAGCSSPSTTNPVTPSAPPPPAFVLSGNYTLTMTPSPSCTVVSDRITGQRLPLPDVAGTPFDAVVTQQALNVTFDFAMGSGDISYHEQLEG